MSSRTWWSSIVKDVIDADMRTKSLSTSLPSNMDMDKMAYFAYDEFSKAECWREHAEWRAVLDELRRRCRRLRFGIVSNFDERIHAIMRNLDNMHAYFDFVVVPGEATRGHGKPRREIFERALRLSGLADPAHITHVGNDVECDYFGALNAGFRAILIGSLDDESKVSELGELVKSRGKCANSFKDLLNLID